MGMVGSSWATYWYILEDIHNSLCKGREGGREGEKEGGRERRKEGRRGEGGRENSL